MRVWTKNANCWEILRKFWKFLMKILLKNWIFIFFLFVILFFYFIFRKFVTKNRAFGNNTNFRQQQFFRFRGGNFHPSPLATPLYITAAIVMLELDWQNSIDALFTKEFKEGMGAKRREKIEKNWRRQWCYFPGLFKMTEVQRDRT